MLMLNACQTNSLKQRHFMNLQAHSEDLQESQEPEAGTTSSMTFDIISPATGSQCTDLKVLAHPVCIKQS